MADNLRFFSDSERENPISQFKFPRSEVGKTHTAKIYIANTNHQWPIKNIKVSKDDDQLTFKHPESLIPDGTDEVEIIWTPSLNRNEPLDLESLFEGELWIG